MPLLSIVEKIRRLFMSRSQKTGVGTKVLRLVQLEDRRMLNATFVFDGVAALDLAGFDTTGGTNQISVNDTGTALEFTLNGGTWSADVGNVADAGITGAGTGTLSVAKSVFEDAGDQLALTIDAQIAGASNVNFVLNNSIVLPDSPTDGAFAITSDGAVTLGFTVDGAGNDFAVDTTGAISQTAALSNIGNLDYDAGTTIGISASIATDGTVDVDSTGLTTIGATGDITAGGAVTFGTAKAGFLTTSGDIDTTDDNITFSRAVTLGGNVDFDTTGTAAGNIHFASTVATVGNNLTLDAGAAGNIDLDAAATGGGDFVARDGAVQNYSVLTLDSVDILDATTSVTFNGTVTVTANNANGGLDAFKVNTPGLVTIGGTLTATSTAALNVDIDPTNVNVNADILATGQIDLTASNDISIGAFTVRADTDGDGGTLNITADDDASGAGNISAVNGSILRGHTVNLFGFDITTDVVTSDVGNLAIQAANEVTLNDSTTSTAAQVLVTATANDVNLTGAITAGTNTTITAGGAIVDGNAGALNITAGTATLFAVNGIGSGDAIETNITQLEATNTTTGTIEITELAAGVDIALGAVNNGTRDVLITAAAGAITDGNAAALNITAGTATLSATAGIGSGNAIETNITQLEATNTTTGTIEITELAAGVDIALGAVNNGTRDVLITAAAGAITDGNAAALNITAGTATLSATAGIGSGNAIETNITQLEATNTTTGTIEITELAAGVDIALGAVNNGTRDVLITAAAGAITDGNAAALNITAGTATLSATAGIGSGNAIETNITQLEATNTTTGTIEITELAAGVDIALGAVNNGTRDVLITAAAGAITDGNAGALNITAGTATLSATAGIGSGNAIETNITQLEATNTTTGTIEITELAAGVDIALGAVNNGTRDVLITAAAGAITDGNAGALNITAGTATLSATAGISSGNAIETNITQLQATNTTTGTIEITEVAAGVDIALGAVANVGRDVVIQSLGGTILDGNGAAVNVTARDLTLNAPIGSIGASSSDVFKGVFDPIEIALSGNLTASAPLGAVAISGPVAGTQTITALTLYIQSVVDIDVSATVFTFTNLALLTAGKLTIADTGLAVTGDLRIEANDVDAATAGNPVLLGSAGTRIDRLLYQVTNAADEFVSVFTDQLDVRTNSSVQIHANGDTAFRDLNCDLTSLNSNNNVAVVTSVAGLITQGANLGAVVGTTVNDRMFSGSLLLLGTGSFVLGNAQNDVDTLAASVTNSIVFRDSDSLSIGSVSSLFPAILINGVSTLNNNVMISTGDFLTLNQQVHAGTADARLVAEGDITQSATGIITADELGVRQESAAGGSILLGDNNDVNTLAASNAFAAGVITFNDTDDLTIGAVAAQVSDGVNFAATSGLATTNGDILLNANGFLTLNQQVNAGTADARLVADGNITQSATGIITADELGVRQESAAGGSILLGDNNDVNTLAASNAFAAGVITFNDTDDLTIGAVAAQVSDGVNFAATNGVATTNGDILLNANGFLTLNQQVHAGTADARLMADGDMTQSAVGIITADELGVRQDAITLASNNDTDSNGQFDILLGQSNDVRVASFRNRFGLVSSNLGGSIVYSDIDDLTISSISDQMLDGVEYKATSGAVSLGHNATIQLTSTGNLTVNANVEFFTDTDEDGITDSLDVTNPDPDSDGFLNDVDPDIDGDGILNDNDTDPAPAGVFLTHEIIALTSTSGDITLGNGVRISTDQNFIALTSTNSTADSITLNANNGTGTINFGNVVTLRTDGGVAHQFVLRPFPGTLATAFFINPASPIPSVVTRSGLNYVVTFNIAIGVAGEENLRLDIDWRDPSTGLGDTSDLRLDSVYLDHGMRSVKHTFSFSDFNAFVNALNPIFNADFSVSQHQSIQIDGGTVTQGGNTEAVAGGKISSTDDVTTGTGGTGPFDATQAGVDRTVATVTDNTLSNVDFHFENGLVQIVIPTLFLPPNVPDPPQPAPPAPPVAVQNLVVPPLVLVTAVEVPETPFSSYSTQSEDYFQLREFDGVTRKVVEKYEHIADEFGELLLQPAQLKLWVTREHFQDRVGLELWLITEKHTSNGPVTVERPVLKFDIANGQPFPAKEAMPTEFEELKLIPMPLDDNFNDPSLDESDGAEEAPIGDPSASVDDNSEGTESNGPNINAQSRVFPLRAEDGTVEMNNEVHSTFSSSPVRSMLTTIAVAAVLNQNRISTAAPSKSRQLLNRILNRQRNGDNL